jgi:hypothetical protein
MAPSNRASLVIRGGVICAALGSLIGGCASLLISAVRGNFVLESLSLIPMAILFAAITAAPFGFAVGAIGVLWLTFRSQRTSGRRLYLEAAGMGAALGGYISAANVNSGMGPFENLLAARPISIGTGIIFGIVLSRETRRATLAA